LAVPPPDEKYDLEFMSQLAAAGPFRDEPFEVAGMNHELRPVAILPGRDAEIVEPLLVVKDDGPVGRGHPDDRGDGIGQLAKPLFALAQSLLGPFTFRDVVRESEDAPLPVERDNLSRHQYRPDFAALRPQPNFQVADRTLPERQSQFPPAVLGENSQFLGRPSDHFPAFIPPPATHPLLDLH